MIISGLLDLIYKVMNTLLILDIPNLPDEVHGYIDQAFTYIVAGGSVIANYAPLGYLLILFGVLLAVDIGILYYHFVLWVLKKIPLAGIS